MHMHGPEYQFVYLVHLLKISMQQVYTSSLGVKLITPLDVKQRTSLVVELIILVDVLVRSLGVGLISSLFERSYIEFGATS